MKKKTVLVFLIFLVQMLLFSAVSRIDSLQNSLASSPGAERIEVLSALASEFFQSGNYDQALIYQRQIRELSRRYDDQSALAGSLSETGYIYQSTADYEQAIEYYQQALEVFEELHDKANIGLLLNRIGSTFKKIGDMDKSLEYYRKALTIRQEIGDRRGVAGSYNNIGIIYQDRKEYQKALELYFEALEINEEMDNLHWKSINLGNIGFTKYLLGNFDKALEYLFRSLQIKKARKDIRGALHVIGNISSVYHQIGQIGKAIEYMEESLQLAEEIGSRSHILNCYRDLAEYHRAAGDYQTAYQYKESFIALNDSLFTQEKIARINEIQTRYETEKKEQEITSLTQRNKMQKQFRNLLMIIILLILVLAAILIQRYRKNLQFNRLLQKQKQLLEESKAQIEDINRNLEKRVETEVKIRQEQQQKALEQSRLAALGELAAGIAHEINQPLHSIAFAIDNLRMAMAEDEADEEYLNKKFANMFEDVSRMKRIIDHIRTFSRKQTDQQQEPFVINESIQNAVRMIAEQYASHRIRIETDLASDMPPVLGNLYRFEQVVLILLSNGNDALEEKAVYAGNDYQKRVSITTFSKGSEIILKFEDNGVGMEKSELEKIFNPFYTTKKPGEGTGLGLSIAFGIVSEMQGNIEVESEAGVGTKISIHLPQISNQEG